MNMSHKIFVSVIGVGLVGSEFISQLLAVKASPFRLISLTSSTRTLYNPDGLPTESQTWKAMLANSTQKADLQLLTKQLSSLISSSAKVVLVDNTASEDVATMYPLWLRTGINVITPNKKAFSGEQHLYEQIVLAAQQSGAKFFNESTVGAGLPIISTLKDLVITGDEITKIEGVFSGTMSYIFNEFSTGKPDGPSFSSVVSIAREKGYTEPHPADDLNGFDVARKLTILSRIIASSSLPPLKSFLSVQTTSLIPAALENIPTGDEFISRLPEFDAHFDAIRKDASKQAQVLRYVGVIDPANGIVKAGLEKYSTTHPFASSLGGSDNIVLFHTARYGVRPLIVQGAGAGAAVTAMGVLADLFKLC